jgi:MYXO-CTERM domain-containing protein
VRVSGARWSSREVRARLTDYIGTFCSGERRARGTYPEQVPCIMSARPPPSPQNAAKVSGGGPRSPEHSSSTWIARASASRASLGALALALAVGACGPAPSSGEVSGATSEAIYGGTLDNDAQQNQAVVSLKIGDTTPFELCSASLIAPNVVLTARHCVSVNLTQGVACDENGASGNGPQVGADEPVATIHVYLGANPNFGGVPAASGKAIFHTASDVLCNGDMALVVLDRNINGVTPLKVRLTTATASGEKLRSVGYGQNDKQLPVGTRLRKDGVGVLAVGKVVSSNLTALAANELEVGLSICQGDSGGPALSETTGAVVGVVSRGGQCTDDFGHIYTTVSGFKAVFDAAFQVAGGAPIDESASAPTPPVVDAGGPSGSTPSDDGGTGGNGSTPTQGAHSVPNLHSGAGQGCSASGAPSPAGTTFGGIALGMLAALGLFVARRRRG